MSSVCLISLSMFPPPSTSTLFPYTTLFRSPLGRDIFRIGDALGAGSVAALVDGRTEKVADVAERKWRIISEGPVRVVVELTRSEEHTSELRHRCISYAVFCLKKKKTKKLTR